MKYYDMDGKPISLEAWAQMYEQPGSRRVAETLLPNGFSVSTVLLGLDHNFGGGPPLIFETMVFDAHRRGLKAWGHLDMQRYSTKAQADAGHEAMAKKWSKTRRCTHTKVGTEGCCSNDDCYNRYR